MKKCIVLIMGLVVMLVLAPITVIAASQQLQSTPQQQEKPTPSFTTITPLQAKQLIDTRKDLLLVDIRNPDELTEGAIEGSELIPLMDIVKGRREVPQDKPILLICAVGGRSLALGKLMSKYGWPEIYNLKGGISAWKESGLPVKY